jgi:hypothetical protein
MQTRYEIRAQWVPLTGDDESDQGFWADFPLKKVSKLRCAKSIFLSKAPCEFPVLDFKQEIKMEIGGVFGLGS